MEEYEEEEDDNKGRKSLFRVLLRNNKRVDRKNRMVASTCCNGKRMQG